MNSTVRPHVVFNTTCCCSPGAAHTRKTSTDSGDFAWADPAAWGLMLADIARHAANAYSNDGHNRSEVLAKIREMMDAELRNPTDEPEQIS